MYSSHVHYIAGINIVHYYNLQYNIINSYITYISYMYQ